MLYCQYCGTELGTSANFCPNCGAALNETNTQTSGSQTAGSQTTAQSTSSQWSNTAKTVGTVAGAAVGVSLLGNLLRRRRRPPIMPPHGPMGGHGMHGGGPMGGPGGRGHGPMGGPGGRGHGPMGGPGGRR